MLGVNRQLRVGPASAHSPKPSFLKFEISVGQFSAGPKQKNMTCRSNAHDRHQAIFSLKNS